MSNQSILMIEPNKTLASQYQCVLQDLGCAVEHSTSVREALEKLEKNPHSPPEILIAQELFQTTSSLPWKEAQDKQKTLLKLIHLSSKVILLNRDLFS